MRALVLTCLLLAGLAGLAGPAMADEAAHRASAERFLKLAKAEGMTAPVYQQVTQLVNANFSQMGGSMQYEPILARYQQRARAEVDKVLSWEAIRDELIDLYLPLFSQAEFDELSRFYESEVGRRLMDNLPDLTAASLDITRTRVEQQLAPRMQELIDEMAAEVEKQQGGLR